VCTVFMVVPKGDTKGYNIRLLTDVSILIDRKFMQRGVNPRHPMEQ